MDATKKDKFMKELISHETFEAVTELKKIIKEQRGNSTRNIQRHWFKDDSRARPYMH